MKEIKLLVLLENLNIQCRFRKYDACGYWCTRSDPENPHYANCDGLIKNCDMTSEKWRDEEWV